MPNRGTQQQVGGPKKLNGEPDLRFKQNEQEGTAVYDSRHRNPHPGQPSPIRQRHDRPVGDDGDIVNADGTLDMRFLENRIKAGLVEAGEVDIARQEAEEDEPDVPAHRRTGRKTRGRQ